MCGVQSVEGKVTIKMNAQTWLATLPTAHLILSQEEMQNTAKFARNGATIQDLALC